MDDMFNATSTACQVIVHSDSEVLCHPLARQRLDGPYTFLNSSSELLDVMRVVLVNIVRLVVPQNEVQRVEVWGMGRPDLLFLQGDYPVVKLVCLVSFCERVFDLHFFFYR